MGGKISTDNPGFLNLFVYWWEKCHLKQKIETVAIRRETAGVKSPRMKDGMDFRRLLPSFICRLRMLLLKCSLYDFLLFFQKKNHKLVTHQSQTYRVVGSTKTKPSNEQFE